MAVQPEVYQLVEPQSEASALLLRLHHHRQEMAQVLDTFAHGCVKGTQLGTKLIQHLLCTLHWEVAAWTGMCTTLTSYMYVCVFVHMHAQTHAHTQACTHARTEYCMVPTYILANVPTTHTLAALTKFTTCCSIALQQDKHATLKARSGAHTAHLQYIAEAHNHNATP